MFAYSAICDVPEETLLIVTWMVAGPGETGAAVFRDDASLRQLAAEAGIGISTAYRYRPKEQRNEIHR